MKVRPSAWWYALVPIIALAGFGFGIAAAIDEGRAVADTFQRFGSDGRTTVSLDEGDETTVFAMYGDGRDTSALQRPTATVAVEGPDGDEVAFDAADSGGETTFDFGGDAGIDLGTFTARSDGEHEVRVKFVDDAVAGAPTAAIGRLDVSAIVGTVLRPMGSGILASIAVLILLLVLRGASKRRLRSSPLAPPTDPGSSRGPFV